MYYEETRDLLLLATNDGSFAIAKVNQIHHLPSISNNNSNNNNPNTNNSSNSGSLSSNSSNRQRAEIKILKRGKLHRTSIHSLSFYSKQDTLSTISQDQTIGIWRNITGISYEQGNCCYYLLLVEE